MSIDIHAILRKNWGYKSFRPLQEDIINSVISGRDTLGLMPTGGGKSITFQVAGLALGCLTIVVTPLIALMKDQVDNLRHRGIKAIFLHSSMTYREQNIAREKLINGSVKFLYVSPEKLANERFLGELKSLGIGLIVVDEAHCISQWGYDFRPSYLNIGKLRKVLPKARIMAVTATATAEVAEDICRSLGFRNPALFRTGFRRDNLRYVVREPGSRLSELIHILRHTSGASIVYVRSRRHTREIAESLQGEGITASFYHAGLDFEEKEKRQNQWMRGDFRVMVATNAFGMGIDKEDVRVVVHIGLPPSLEEYYQEAGRAGRDGKKSYVVLLAKASDKALATRRINEAFPPRETIVKIYERVLTFLRVIVGEGYGRLLQFNLEKFCDIFGYKPMMVKSALKILSSAGYLEFVDETENSSRLMIICDKETLYESRNLNQKADLLLTTVLRRYTGLFADYAYISESVLARHSGLSEQEVYDTLIELTKLKILHYIPRTRTPYIYITTAREEGRYIRIGKKDYEERRAVMERRNKAILDYAFGKDICRERAIVAYFGEVNASDCGHCDVCLSRRPKLSDTTQLTALMKAKARDFLKKYPRGAKYPLLHNLLEPPAELAHSVLDDMFDAGELKRDPVTCVITLPDAPDD